MQTKASPKNGEVKSGAVLTADQVNVLLVDDKPSRLLSYEVALESLGHNLVRAQSGTQALERLMEMDFAAILLDVSMPEIDGFETASLIRQHPRFEDTPIIFVTGVHVTDVDSLKGYAIGAVDYVYIPVVPEILRGKVQALVQLYIQRAELCHLNQQLAAANAELAKAHEDLKVQNMRELQRLNGTLERANNELVATNLKLTQEISERQRAEEELRRAARRKDEYIAILGHELRNPLSAIHNAVQVMQLHDATDEQQAWARELLQRQVTHLTCLMDDLLDVSRISSGRIELRLEPVDLATVVTHAAETVATLLEERGHQLDVVLPDEPLCVNGDSVRLTQVLDNLLTNAAKYMESGGVVRLELEADGSDWAVIRVRDHGVGIPPEFLESVFDLFVQVPTAVNRAHGGLGIGLALVRALVELHGGSTAVTSDGPGCGAEFSVRLPLWSEATATSTPSSNHTAAATTGSRILIVDDNEDSARALAMYLENQGHELCLRHNGEDGIAAAHVFRPDVILLDIGLPDIDGYEVVSRLRKKKRFASLSIIAITGYGGEAERRQAKQVGFDHYLVKPLNYSRLVALLETRN